MEPTELSACGAEVAGQEAGLEQQRHRVAVGGWVERFRGDKPAPRGLSDERASEKAVSGDQGAWLLKDLLFPGCWDFYYRRGDFKLFRNGRPREGGQLMVDPSAPPPLSPGDCPNPQAYPGGPITCPQTLCS